MNPTREDVLRELELMPVWKLRAPLKVAEPVAEKALIVEVAAEVAVEATKENTSLELIISDDKKWIFICPETRMDIASQSMLFSNILRALKITKTNKIALENIGEASVIVVMGETAAQQLLNTTESIEALRGKTHTYQNIPLIVTYDTQNMLENLANKAKTWDDLCMALQLLNA
jgi:uracil-DNA glycosylase